MRKSIDDNQPGKVEFLKIVGWSDYLHPDLTRKVKPPFRWLKLQTENLDTLGDLTLKEYGAYCRLLNLAALTNNQIVLNMRAIKRRTGITQKDVEKLQNRGLIQILNRAGQPENNQQNQGDDFETASGLPAGPPQVASPEGRGWDRSRSDKKGLGDSQLPNVLNEDSPTRTPYKPNGYDPRSFDDLKAQVLMAAMKLNSSDPNRIHLLAGQSLRMSSKQVDAAVKQLIEDRQL